MGFTSLDFAEAPWIFPEISGFARAVIAQRRIVFDDALHDKPAEPWPPVAKTDLLACRDEKASDLA